ncbi:glycosyl transferase [Candidatus Gracilibacteria bacterium]|nr:glycosyl transferase [Candidatus Gracilibacteria bacterium]
MIPKKIHYCWFGKNPKPQKALDCIESWYQFLPEYEIIEWNEENFDISQNMYAREAYEAQKYAFVSDFARLKILYDEGGIYLDTDVEVVKNFDDFLHHGTFMGFEYGQFLATCVIGAEAKNHIIGDFLKLYEHISFRKNSKNDYTTNVARISDFLTANFPEFQPNNSFQILNNNFAIYPQEFFSPIDDFGKTYRTNKTVTLHHHEGSWAPWYLKILYFLVPRMKRLLRFLKLY